MAWLSNVLLLCVLHLVAGGGYLLPLDVVPSHYDVKLTYDVDPATNFSFYGLVDILVTAKKATTKIVLHSEDHEIDEQQVRLSGSPGKPCVTGVEREDTYSLLTLTLDRPLEAGENYTLTIPFRGNLKMGLDGAYVSSYYNTKTKQKEYLITTQFEATSARKGFPCFDEPMFKSTFKITIGHCKDYTAVSNMPLARSSQDNPLEVFWPWNIMAENFKKQKSEFVWDEFDVSVPMSTYLIAYVVSKFEYVESPAGLSTTKFRIWARSDALDQTEYAARIGPTVLTHFEKWFNVSFPLPKQDMMAIPDFAAGAMENWGLITYRETALLYHKEQSSFLNKERVAEVIAHELAHQWFGNLVTMKWWSDLWLNEGFATFAASVGVAAAEPAWRAHRSYAVDNTLAVLSLDALETSHPVSVPIDDPKRISEIFDEISYRKGSTLIRMMTMFLGEEVFRKAIHNYLVKYSYQNAEQDDLWRELTAASEQHGILPRDTTVKDIMDTWTTQTGYPVLTVSRDYTDGSLTITQKRYVSLGARAATAASWWVPLSVVARGEAPAPLQWLAPNEGLARPQRYTHPAAKDDWLLLNHDMIAPYRVSYDARNWQLLAAALQSRAAQLPPLGRVQLLADAFALAWTNQLDYNTTLQLASYLSHETDYLPLSTGLKALAKIENTLKRSPEYGAFQKFIRKMIGNAYQNSGGLATKNIIQGDDLESVKMQVMLSGWACRMKIPGCEENAMELYEQWMETENPDENNPIPLELRRTVYCAALARGGVRHWRWALARRAGAAPAARDTLLHALACSRDVWVLAQYLEWAVSDTSEVRRQDSASVISGVIQSTVGYYIGKEFVYERIADIHKAMNGQGRRLGSIIKVLLNQFTTQRELDQFLDWSKTNSKYLEGSKLSVDQAIENAKVNIDWITRNKKTVVAKLREYST